MPRLQLLPAPCKVPQWCAAICVSPDHLWQQVGKQARDTLLAKPGQKMITRLWLRCYKDAKVFRQPRIELKYDDIRELVSDSRISAEKFAIVPARPEAPVSKGNAVLVARDTRDRLLEILRHNTTSLSIERAWICIESTDIQSFNKSAQNNANHSTCTLGSSCLQRRRRLDCICDKSSQDLTQRASSQDFLCASPSLP